MLCPPRAPAVRNLGGTCPHQLYGAGPYGYRAFKMPMEDNICAQLPNFIDPRKVWPFEVVTLAHFRSLRGPILMQHDFFSLMLMSNHLSSISHTWKRLCSSPMEGAINKISSAYSMIYDLGVSDRAAWTSFKYIANMIGDKTEPCLTPNLTSNLWENVVPFYTRHTIFKPIFKYIQ